MLINSIVLRHMEEIKIIEKLPAKGGIIGVREIAKCIKAGNVKKVIIARNCPEFLIDKINKINKNSIEIQMFNGDQKELGTRLGKNFPVAMVGYE